MSRADLDAQRVLFEAWAISFGWVKEQLTLNNSDEYPTLQVQTAWEGWQAALAAQEPVQGEPVANDAENAARYRWLRDGQESAVEKIHAMLLYLPDGVELDAAIDAARKAGT